TVARANLARAGIGNASVRQADIFQLPFESGSHDVAIVHQVLHFLDRPGDAIAEAARTLRAGGRLIVVDFAPHEEEILRHEHAHRRLGFSDEDMENWFRNAHMVSGEIQHLKGDPLTVSIWQADHE
ncbi:MAG: class I SAM-dependent methyltransferase, partial [Paracoccaceae bacterium]|nr:class I SAM-dependent methyltransferase [Paracoccaceae bacterium]